MAAGATIQGVEDAQPGPALPTPATPVAVPDGLVKPTLPAEFLAGKVYA